MTPRLKTALWVQAQVRRCDLELIPVVVARRGDPDAGSVLLKLLRRGGCCLVLRRITRPDGGMGWMVGGGGGEIPESEADEYARQEIEFDRDLWVVEIEDFDERYELDGPIEA
ncbi:MAG TPA: DUF1491 family protein [Alphaproteobacteria bacterium]|nr:DUF1491 family protein [Alphaproteobacteria bacterium]